MGSMLPDSKWNLFHIKTNLTLPKATHTKKSLSCFFKFNKLKFYKVCQDKIYKLSMQCDW